MNYLSKLRTAVLIETHEQREEAKARIDSPENLKRLEAYYYRLDRMIPVMLQPQAD